MGHGFQKIDQYIPWQQDIETDGHSAGAFKPVFHPNSQKTLDVCLPEFLKFRPEHDQKNVSFLFGCLVCLQC